MVLIKQKQFCQMPQNKDQNQQDLERKANMLERKIQSFQRQLTIEAKEEDLIKGYKMKEGTYQIIITVYEANEMEPRGSDFILFKTHKTACDAFVQIQIRDQVRRSKVKQGTNNPIFDEQFFFKFQNMTLEDLDRSTISFKVYDKKVIILRDSLLGTFELDWTNIYFKRNHEVYRGWLTLMDPYDIDQGITGYLLVNIAVLGAEDKVTVHDSAFIKDPMLTMEDTVTMPKLMLIDYAINIEIYRAENLIPLDQFSGNVKAYVIAKFSGNKIDSKAISSCNPEWNQMLSIGTGVPTKSKYILLEVRNKNTIGQDDIIGIIKIPFVDLKEDSKPVWGHLYGPPISGKDISPYDMATKMQIYGQDIGSHYRGRVLYRITGHKDRITTNKRTKIKFEFPFKPTPVVAMKSYTLRLQFLQGFNLPNLGIGKDIYLHVCLGQYSLISRAHRDAKNGFINFYDSLPDKKVHLPEDHKMIPDLIVYLAKGTKQKDRVSYLRIPSHQIVTSPDNRIPMGIYELKADLSLMNIGFNDSPGYLTFRPNIYGSVPPQPINYQQQFGKKQSFIIKIFLYRAKQLPPMNETGDCDPKLVFKFGDQELTVESDYSTFNPIWNKVLKLQVKCENIFDIDLERALICTVYDKQQNRKDNLIGEFMIKISRKMQRKFKSPGGTKIPIIYTKPKWFPIINKKVDLGDPCFGHLLMGCAVIKAKDQKFFSHPEKKFQMIKEIQQKKTIQFFILGIRNMDSSFSGFLTQQKVFVKLRIGGNKQNEAQTQQCIIKQGSSHINQMKVFDLDLAKNKNLVPYVDFMLMKKSFANDTMIGFASGHLTDVIPEIFEEKGSKEGGGGGEQSGQDEQKSETVIDIDELEKQLSVVRERRRKRQAMRSQDKEDADKYMKKVEDLPVPLQLGPIVESTDDTEREHQFEDILIKFKADPKYNFDSLLQNQKDEQQMKQRGSSDRVSSFRSEKMSQRQEEDMLPRKKKSHQSGAKLFQEDQSNKPLKMEKQQSKMRLQNVESDENQDGSQSQKHILMRSKSSESKKSQNAEQNRKIQFEEQERKQAEYNNNQKSIFDAILDLGMRFHVDSDEKRRILSSFDNQESEEKTMSNFDLDANESVEVVEHNDRAIKYKDLERYIKQEEKFTREAMERQANYRYAAAVKLSLFKSKSKNKNQDRETYQDFDTDPGEDLDIIPQWYKGRKILVTDFEELVPNKKIRTFPIFSGGQKIANLDIRRKKKIGDLKFIPLSIGHEMERQKQKKYLKLLTPRSYVCRIYVLKGKSLISNFNKKPTTYLRIIYKDQVFDLQKKTLAKESYNPQFYICQQIPMEIPGPSTVRIQVVQKHNLGKLDQKVLGYSQIDAEGRMFTKKWHYFLEKKPIQLRNLYTDYGVGSQGRLEVWVDLIEKKNWLSNPPYKIHPPPFDEFELRIIVYSTKDCVYKNQAFESNDVYVRGFLGTSEPQQTDTHWACRTVGNFNYRFKFKVNYPPKPEDMYSDQFIVQIWDRDIIGYNNLIGEKRINLNKIHRIIEKAVKRKTDVRAKMKIREKGLALTEKFWFDVYNHKAKDEFGQLVSQGKVQMSFELVPIKKAEEELKNGFGRSSPNMHPTLQDPEGRLSFSFLHPLDFFKQLCGPKLYASICHKLICCFVIIVILVLGYFCLGQIIASAIVPG